jgi:hypothetical protein
MGLASMRVPRGIGGARGGTVNAPPTSPQNGSGGEGRIAGIIPSSLNFSPAIGEITDVTTGRITLGLVNLTILGMLAFYWWTRSAQGGG